MKTDTSRFSEPQLNYIRAKAMLETSASQFGLTSDQHAAALELYAIRWNELREWSAGMIEKQYPEKYKELAPLMRTTHVPHHLRGKLADILMSFSFDGSAA